MDCGGFIGFKTRERKSFAEGFLKILQGFCRCSVMVSQVFFLYRAV